MATKRALVLGGGGVAGIAWETGLLVGLAESGLMFALLICSWALRRGLQWQRS